VEPVEPCWLEVSLDDVRHNVQALKRFVGPRTGLIAVVKADGYGLGAVPMARTALEAGATWLGVARIEEGASLRRAGIEAPILHLASFQPAQARAMVQYRLTPTIADVETARVLAAAVPFGQELAIHLKVDTGLTRYGAQAGELPALVNELLRSSRLRIEGLSTHFATADEPDLSYARCQLERFRALAAHIRALGAAPTLYHAANSAATLALPEAHFDLVRPGITLSGHYPSTAGSRRLSLRPAVSLRARLARVYELPAGVPIGYGRTFVATRRTRAALVPAGYADGLPRAHSNRAVVLIHGQRAPLVGRVSMDQCVADVTAIDGVQPGDEVTLIGRQGADEIGLDEYASWSDTIGHEALCRIGSRVPRYYRQAGHLSRKNGVEGWLAEPAPPALAPPDACASLT
jgi:alanine racemase